MQQFHTTFLQEVSVDSYCFLFNWMFIISSSHTIRRRFGHQTSHMPKHWTTWTSHCMILHASTCIPIDWI
jgi:L-asparagine transporter-like permease